MCAKHMQKPIDLHKMHWHNTCMLSEYKEFNLLNIDLYSLVNWDHDGNTL